MLTATVAALSAAALFAAATALQHRSAGLVTGAAGTPSNAELAGFLTRTLRHPLWVVGLAADVTGFALHALALRQGPLTLVQPLLVTSVAFALPFRQLLEGHSPRRDELGWAAGLTIGLVVLLVVATPTDRTAQPPDLVPTIVSGILIVLGITACFLSGRRSNGGQAAALLGTAAALAFAAVAALLKEIMDIAGRGAWALVTAWPMYALIVAGAVGLVLTQLAYQAGPLSSSLPAITTVNPVVSMVVGVAVFDEKFRNGPADLLGEAVGLALVVIAAIGLTRSASPSVSLTRSAGTTTDRPSPSHERAPCTP
jgi:hypothetical protein